MTIWQGVDTLWHRVVSTRLASPHADLWWISRCGVHYWTEAWVADHPQTQGEAVTCFACLI